MKNPRNNHDVDKIITWRKNKIRWVINQYMIGLIVGVYSMFLHEWLLAWSWPKLAKVLTVTFFVPVLFVCLSIVIVQRRESKRPNK